MRSQRDFIIPFFSPSSSLCRRKLISKSTASQPTPVCGNSNIHYLLVTFSRAAEQAAQKCRGNGTAPKHSFSFIGEIQMEEVEIRFPMTACDWIHPLF